jgi:hypothetical protein
VSRSIHRWAGHAHLADLAAISKDDAQRLPAQRIEATDVPWLLANGGGRVAFTSDATNLVSGDTNDCTDVFVREL